MAQETTGFGIRITVTPTDGTIDAVTFKEAEVTPQGYEGDEKIEQTTNANSAYRSFEPGDLIEKTDISGTVTYDTAELSDIQAVINERATVMITFKSGATLSDKGWLRSFTPQGMSRGNMPQAAIVISLEGESAAGVDSETVVQPS